MNNLELNTTTLSDYWKIDKNEFIKRDLLNPTFNKDVPLFIDPVLLKCSKYKIFNTNARTSYEKFFATLYNKIHHIASLEGNIKKKAENTIKSQLIFKENKGLCLGFSQYGTSGRGTGKYYANILYESAYSLIQKGAEHPIFFSTLLFLEEGIGADYISDMTARIILPELATFTQNIAQELGVKTQKYIIEDKEYALPKHPCYDCCVFILPNDILAPLPSDNEIKNILGIFCNLNNNNDEIRTRINTDIGKILLDADTEKKKTSEIKENVKKYVFKDLYALNELSIFINNRPVKPYDFSKDNLGIRAVADFKDLFKQIEPNIDTSKTKLEIIDNIISEFVSDIENNNKILKALCGKKEAAWQSAFFLYIKQIFTKYNIDINPEVELGRGPIDFKFSEGEKFKVLVEMKLSTNSQYFKGLDRQLELYKKCNKNTAASYYIFVDVDDNSAKSDEKKQKLLHQKKELNLDTKIIFIDGRPKLSASKL